MDDNVVLLLEEINYSLEDVKVIQENLISKIENFDLVVDSLVQINGYLYILVLFFIAVGFFYLMYKIINYFI